ncbi:MAG: ZPR1 zinc finger domain-containing protein [Candidatus Bathyarchaeia archaeon]
MDTNYAQKCPSCDNNSMLTSQTEYEVEHFGAVLLSAAICQRCGYRHSDVISLANREAVALTAKISSLEDLNTRVIKSGTATVSIPEFGATVTPGPYSEGYISNVEGLLEKIEDALTFMLSTAKGKHLKKGQAMLKKMRIARDSKPRFTLIIKDPLGNSAIVSPKPGKIKKRKLTNRELRTIKFGQYAVLEEVTQH